MSRAQASSHSRSLSGSFSTGNNSFSRWRRRRRSSQYRCMHRIVFFSSSTTRESDDVDEVFFSFFVTAVVVVSRRCEEKQKEKKKTRNKSSLHTPTSLYRRDAIRTTGMATPMHGKSADLAMLYADWFHASAASSFADVYRDQPSSHAYDRFHSIPLSSNANDGRLYHKLENADAPKKFFVDRQIKKAKSLSGLIK